MQGWTLRRGKPVTGMGQTSFTAAHVSLAALMDSLVNILIPTCTWPSTNTAVEDLSNLRVREPHTPSQKSLMEPVKTTGRSLAASLILSPNYCWGHTMPCIPMAGLSHSDRQEGQISPRLPQFLLWEWKLGKQALAALFGDLSPSTHAHTHTTHTGTRTHNKFIKTHPHTVCQLYLRIGYAARKLISGIAGLANWGFFCVTKPQMNGMKNLWAPTIYCKWCATQQRYEH